MASDQRKKGLVKGVPSADTVIFQGPPGKDGIPLEKTLRLNGIRAPVLGDPDRPDRKEEPFAYEAREFLRKKIINKQVFFYTENKVADREYGRIIVDDQDIGEVLLREGYAKFIDDMKPQPVNFDKYTKAADKAYDAKKGVYSEDKNLLASKTRKLVKIEDPQGFVEKRKDKPMKGLVEEFRSGLFSVYLPDIDAIIKLSLNAVIIPIMGFKASQDVRCFIDSNFLQRDVEVTFTSYDDRGGYFVGTIKNVDNPSYNLVRELLKEGYARLNGDAYKLLDPADHRSAKQAQDEAQRAKLRCWFNYEDTKKGSSGVEKVEEYQGRVIEVNSGDSLTVENLKNGEQARVYLANLRAPAIGNPKKGEAPKPWAWEAKEYVRNQTIGKKVRVEVEYSKKIPVRLDEENPAEDKEFTFVSIILPNDKNLSELLVGAGLASVVAPRSDDPFTKYMKQLSEAEEEAKKKKSGQHSSKTPVNPGKFTDYADKRNTQKSRQFFEFVKNEPALAGTVEAVLSGSLFKVRLEKQNCYVLFSLGGIRTLSLEKNVPQYERFAKEAVRFSKDQILQRDVELHLNSCTPKGVFQGALFVAKKNFAHTLLEQGLAYAETASKHEERYAVQYKTVEKVAEEKKIGIWGAGIPIRSSGHTRGNTTKPLNETKTGTVTEVNGPDEFFVQFNAKKGLETIEAELAKGKGTEGKLEQPVKKGIPCIAKFSDDGKWYRARIDKLISSTKFGVVFTDYGNYDEVSYDDIRKISPALLAIEPLATKCALAYCEPSGKRTSTYEEAAERLRELIWEKTITMQFAFEDSTTKYGIASEKKGDIKDSANARLISEGLVRLIEDVVPLPNDQLAYLRDEEEKARAKKLGGWGSNDFQEEDEY